jgi:hypothetical protein
LNAYDANNNDDNDDDFLIVIATGQTVSGDNRTISWTTAFE